MVDVFFSYSHIDEELRNELEKHLSILKRQGLIGTWHDRRIGAGNELSKEISDNLEQADIILLLISSDFLASDYCYDIEMTRALERHESGEARVVPVILRPCNWHRTPFGKLLATPTDGKPITTFPSMDEAFVEVSSAIESAVEDLQPRYASEPIPVSTPAPVTSVAEMPRSSNLRIKKEFSDREKDQFIDGAFEYVSNFFNGSLSELKNRNQEIDADFKRIDANHFVAKVYVKGTQKCQCKIWKEGQRASSGSIKYSGNDIMHDLLDFNSYNESLHVSTDGYALLMQPMGMPIYSTQDKQLLTKQGLAEYLWGLFIEPLQR